MLSSPDQLKRTALVAQHEKQKAKMVDFGGWFMPLSYQGVLKEHEAVRRGVGVFDVSHMGQFMVSGPESLDFLQHLTINDVSKLEDGGGQYSAFLNPKGGIIDDLIFYRLSEQKFFLCVNAANIEKDYGWLKEQEKSFSQVTVEDLSQEWSQLAVQGPRSGEVISQLVDFYGWTPVDHLSYMGISKQPMGDKHGYVARTGYTGEKGYELYVPSSQVVTMWQEILSKSSSTGVVPIGLGARDTLRLEACYLLHGSDMNGETSPLEVGLGWATKLNKGDFVGKAALVAQKESGVSQKLYGFFMTESAVARSHMSVYRNQEKIGYVTSGGFLPTVKEKGGLCLLNDTTLKVSDSVQIDVRGKLKEARIVKRPFYQAKIKN